MANRTWKETALAVPGVGVSMLPKVICPVCSPAYAAVLSSLPSSRRRLNEVKAFEK